MSNMLKIYGKFIVKQNGKVVAESSNVVTKAAKDAILRALAQVSGGGDEIGSSFYVHHIAVGELEAVPPNPDTWYNAALTSLGDVHGDAEISTPPVAIDDSAGTSVQVVFETSWTNGTGGALDVNFLGAINATGDYTADNVLSVCSLGSTVLVPVGGTMDITYILGFLYNS